jgi:hypothetical protein
MAEGTQSVCFYYAVSAQHLCAITVPTPVLRLLPARAYAVLAHPALTSDQDSQIIVPVIGDPILKAIILRAAS